MGGILAGFSNGLVLTCGASCGGLDILGLYLSKKGKGFTVGKFSLLFNAALYTLCLILFSAPTAIYSAIYTVFNALFVDRVHHIPHAEQHHARTQHSDQCQHQHGP